MSRGTSSQKVGEVAQTLMGVAPSASAVSRLNRTLTEQFEEWRTRTLQTHWRILYLDGIHFEVRHGDQVDSTMILVALGVDLEGNKEILAMRACAEESKVYFAAYAYPTHEGEPAIDHVNFTLYWQGVDPRKWVLACTSYKPIKKDTFACTADLHALGAPTSEITISFDVYDKQGNHSNAPNGVHTVTYAP